jgi:hypothetical protein
MWEDLTPFERIIQNDRRWKFVYDEASSQLVGYVRHSKGFTVVVDRRGDTVFTDETPVEPSLISPIDFIGAGLLLRAFGPLLGRGVVSLSRIIAGAGARKAAANLAASGIRVAARTAAKQAAQAAVKQVGALGRRQALIDAIVREFPIYGAKVRDLCKFCNDGALMNIAKALGVVPK